MFPIEHPAGQVALDFLATESQHVAARVRADIDAVKAMFWEKQQQANINADFWMGRQWTEEEAIALAAQGRYPYVFNEIQNKVNHLVGTQIQTRLDSKCLPREPDDASSAALLTAMIKWVEQINNIEETESSVFQDSLVKGLGAALVRWEISDVRHGYVRVEKIPINELFWDANSKVDDLSDARWCARVMHVTRLDALELLPQFAEEITSATTIDSNGVYSQVDSRTRRQQQVAWHQEAGLNGGRQVIQIIEHYERCKKKVHIVIDSIQGTTHRFDEEKKAVEFFDGLTATYTDAGEILTNLDGTEKITLETVAKDAIIQSIVIGSEAVHREFTSLPAFPYVINFCYFNDGDYWSFVDNLRDPQVLVNRSFSQYDHELANSNKQLMTVVEPALAAGLTVEDVREERAKTGATLPVRSHQAIQSHPHTPANPELFNSINYGISRMHEYAGGKNAMGLTESAAESGRAVVARAEAGGVARLPLFDRLRSWRRRLSSLVVWYIKNYMPADQIVRVVGTSGEVDFVSLDTGDVDSIRELEFDIQVSEAAQSDTLKERQFQQLTQFLSTVPIPSEISMPLLLELSSIPEKIKEEILTQIEFQKEYTQRKMQMEEEAKIRKQAEDSVQRQRFRDEILQAQMQQQGQAVQTLQGAGQPPGGEPIQPKLTDEQAALEALQGVGSPAARNEMFNRFQGEELAGRNKASVLSSLNVGAA